MPFTSKDFSQSLLEGFPKIIDSWGHKNTFSPNDIGRTSTKQVHLVCPNNHEFYAKPSNFSKKNEIVCHECKSISFNFPDILDKLIDKSQGSIPSGSHKLLGLLCDVGHEYFVKANKVTSRGDGCYFCSSHRVLCGFNDVGCLLPEVSKLFVDQSLPHKTLAYSNKKFDFVCEQGHEWNTWLSNVSSGRRCGNCSDSKTSSVESTVMEILSEVFTLTHTLPNDRVPVLKNTVSVDMLLHHKGLEIAVEFDGSYWHKDSYQRDINKTRKLLDSGYHVVRIREQSYFTLDLLPLEHPNLLQVKVPMEYYREKYKPVLEDVLLSIVTPWIKNLPSERDTHVA